MNLCHNSAFMGRMAILILLLGIGAFTLAADLPPAITTPPQDTVALRGGSVTFSVEISDPSVVTNAVDSQAGFSMPLTNTYALTGSAALAVIQYDYFNIPDHMRIYLNGNLIHDAGLPSGSGTFQIGFPSHAGDELSITMNEEDVPAPTFWQYVLTLVSGDLNFQWRKNGVDIPGATNWVHTITNTQPSDAAAYSVRVGNAAGSVNSNPAELVVCTAPLLVSPVFSTNGIFSMTIQAEAGCPCQVEKTTNLTQQSWAPIALLPNITGQVQFSETNTPAGAAAFYRVRPLP